MLTYLARNTRLALEYSVNKCASFQLNPKKVVHENRIKVMGTYLLGTREIGIIFKPDLKSFNSIQCYVDADFARNCSKEKMITQMTASQEQDVSLNTQVFQFIGSVYYKER